MVRIQVNNNAITLHGSMKTLNEVYDSLAVRNPNAHYLRRYMKPGWDGKYHLIKENGTGKTGILPAVYSLLKEMGHKVEFEDFRGMEEIKYKIPKRLGTFKFRPYQVDALRAIARNKVGDLWFPRGIIKAATNAGKTAISAGIHKMFKQKTILLTNSTELFEQGLEEWEQLLPGKVGYVGKGKAVWNDFMVCMVKTLSNNARKYANELHKYKVVIVDECDLANNKTFDGVLKYLFNAPIKVGLTGTIFMSKLKKDELKAVYSKEKFGELLYDISNKKLIDEGYSSKVEIKIIKGNTKKVPTDLTWKEVYEKFIVLNGQRNKRVVKRVVTKYLAGKKPILVIGQRQKHIKIMYNRLSKALPGAKIGWVHHDRKGRFDIVNDFKNGYLEILVGSMILKRGKNFPLMQYMLNAAGGKGPEGAIQLLGRATRKHVSKEVTEYEDMWDEGNYLKSHSRRRVAYYKNEQIPVTNKYS